MNTQLTINQRFGRVVDLLISRKLVDSQTELAEKLGYKSKSSITGIVKGNQNPSLSNLVTLRKDYGVSLEYIIMGTEPEFHSDFKHQTKEIAIPQRDLISIPMTNIQAAAGAGMVGQDYIESEDVIEIPSRLVKKGSQTYLCIRVKGHSMAPTLQDGGYVIIRLMDRGEWVNLREEYIYVIVTTEGSTNIKRVKNRFPKGFIVLMSDNPDKASFPNITLPEDEIAHIWYAEWYLSAKMPNIHNQYYSRLQALEDRVDDIEDDLKMVTIKPRNNI